MRQDGACVVVGRSMPEPSRGHIPCGAHAGAFVFEASDIEAAVALAARIPQARLGGAVEVRPAEKYF